MTAQNGKTNGGKRPGSGRKPHQPTERTRGIVIGAVASGTPQEDIARLLKITVDTLAKYYRPEIDDAVSLANAQVAQTLFKKATSKDLTGPSVTAAIWWEKSRAGMKETIANEHTGKDGSPLQIVIAKEDKGL